MTALAGQWDQELSRKVRKMRHWSGSASPHDGIKNYLRSEAVARCGAQDEEQNDGDD